MYYLDCTTIVKQWHWKRLYLHRVHPSCATHWGRSIRFVYQGRLSTASIKCVHPVSSLGASIRCVHRVRPSGASIRCVHWECPSGVFISDRVCHQVRRLDTFISCIYGVRPSGEKFTLNITIICTFGLKNKLNNQRKWGFKHAAHPFCPNTIPKIPSFMKQIAGYTSFFLQKLENDQITHVQIQHSTNQTELLIGLKNWWSWLAIFRMSEAPGGH